MLDRLYWLLTNLVYAESWHIIWEVHLLKHEVHRKMVQWAWLDSTLQSIWISVLWVNVIRTIKSFVLHSAFAHPCSLLSIFRSEGGVSRETEAAVLCFLRWLLHLYLLMACSHLCVLFFAHLEYEIAFQMVMAQAAMTMDQTELTFRCLFNQKHHYFDILNIYLLI